MIDVILVGSFESLKNGKLNLDSNLQFYKKKKGDNDATPPQHHNDHSSSHAFSLSLFRK
jgi:hypothetical protein